MLVNKLEIQIVKCAKFQLMCEFLVSYPNFMNTAQTLYIINVQYQHIT